MKETNSEKLQNEYSRLVEGNGSLMLGLTSAQKSYDQGDFLSNPILPVDILAEAVPGNIRQAEHFVGFLRRFVEYIKVYSSNI
jgi:DNA excision repair protein ERCC-2